MQREMREYDLAVNAFNDAGTSALSETVHVSVP